MRRSIILAFGLLTAIFQTSLHADTTVMAVRLGASDVPALAAFYEAAFGLKAIDQVGTPPTEIIMRYGATVAEAKGGTSPEFLVQLREPGTARNAMAHAIFRVSDMDAAVTAAKAAGATMDDDIVTVPIGGMPVKIAFVVDPQGNTLELMELPADAAALSHP